jgi:hypothetical protein
MDDQTHESKLPNITEGKSLKPILYLLENVKVLQEELENLKKKHEQRLEEFKQKNQTFVDIMNEYTNDTLV